MSKPEFTKGDWHIFYAQPPGVEVGPVWVSHRPCTKVPNHARYYFHSWIPNRSEEATCSWCKQPVPDEIQALALLRSMEVT